MLTITTPATGTALTTRQKLRDRFAGLSDKSDALLDAFIAEASSRVVGYCQRDFGLATYRQTTRMHGNCRTFIHLPFETPGPIVQILALTVDGVTKTEGTDFEREGEILYRLSSDHRIPWPRSKIVVDFVAGYSLPDAVATPTLPAAVEGACQALAARLAVAELRDPSLSAETIFGVAKFEYAGVNDLKNGLPADLAGALDPFVVRTLA